MSFKNLKKLFGDLISLGTGPMEFGPVWAIEIGASALRAMHCLPSNGCKIIVDAFDCVSYSDNLANPDADREELIDSALQTFLSAHNVGSDAIVISIPGRNGLVRFFKLPPVEERKVQTIMEYEARQQIPFDLQDVIWKSQLMFGAKEDGFLLESEHGLFALKRDKALEYLYSFRQAGLRVRLMQLKPMALYNFAVFDLMANLPMDFEYNTELPPKSIAIVSVGSEDTDLVITDGFRIWARNIPLGGGHFTKRVAKELNLSFAEAELAKCNATSLSNSEEILRAMNVVFNDLLTELQRSFAYYCTIAKTSKIGQIVLAGNTFKLPGLQQFLAGGLKFEQDSKPKLVRLESFNKLHGLAVLGNPFFQNSFSSFATCYGLAIQALGHGKLKTNLLP